MVRAADRRVALEAAAARGHHLAGGEGDQAEPGQPRHQQGGEGRPDEVLALQRPRQTPVPLDRPDPGKVTKEKTCEVTLAPHTAVQISRVSILVYFWCPTRYTCNSSLVRDLYIFQFQSRFL